MTLRECLNQILEAVEHKGWGDREATMQAITIMDTTDMIEIMNPDCQIEFKWGEFMNGFDKNNFCVINSGDWMEEDLFSGTFEECEEFIKQNKNKDIKLSIVEID